MVRGRAGVWVCLVGLGCAGWLGGCSDAAAPQDMGDEGVAFEVGPSGGTFVSPGNEPQVRLEVPAGAVPGDVVLTVKPAASFPDDPTVVAGTVFEFGPDGIRFARPVRLEIRYQAARLPAGLDAGSLRIHKVIAGAWSQIPGGGVDTVARRIWAAIDGFSTYGGKGTGGEDGGTIDGPIDGGPGDGPEGSDLPATDGGQPATDGGQPATDGAPATDGGQPVDDGGQPVDDGGQPVDDGGQPVDDGGDLCGPCSTAEPCKTASCVAGICTITDAAEGAACDGGQCHAGACCTGCWDGASCQDGGEASACGEAGGSCSVCESAEACGVAACVAGSCGTAPALDGIACDGGQCQDGACCTGCWDGASCLIGDALDACGASGATCELCEAPSTCQVATCEPTGCTLTDVVDGTACAGGQCRGGACCAGCWDGAACQAGTSSSACGSAGGACAACPSGGECRIPACGGGVCTTWARPDGTACSIGVCEKGACVLPPPDVEICGSGQDDDLDTLADCDDPDCAGAFGCLPTHGYYAVSRSGDNVAYRMRDENGDGDVLDPGETVAIYTWPAADSPNIVAVHPAPDGSLLALHNSYAELSRLYRLTDTDGDGVLETATEWIDPLQLGNSQDMVVASDGSVYVSNSTGTYAHSPTVGIIRLRDLNGDGDANDAGELVAFATDHPSKLALRRDPCDGDDVLWSNWYAARRYRDLNGDGDALDPGESMVVGYPPTQCSGSDLGIAPDPRSRLVYGLRRCNSNPGQGTITRYEDKNGDGDMLDANEATVLGTYSATNSVSAFFDDDGRLFATSTATADAIFELTDTDGDGKLEKRLFATGLDSHVNVHFVPRPTRATIFYAVSRDGDHTAYRIRDLNGDGDALDPGETRALYTWPATDSPNILAVHPAPDGAYFAVHNSYSDLSRLYRLTDTDNDGVLDSATEWVDPLVLGNTQDVVVGSDGSVYVNNANGTYPHSPTLGILRIRDLNGDGDAKDAGEVISFATDQIYKLGLRRDACHGDTIYAHYGGLRRYRDDNGDGDALDAGESAVVGPSPTQCAGADLGVAPVPGGGVVYGQRRCNTFSDGAISRYEDKNGDDDMLDAGEATLLGSYPATNPVLVTADAAGNLYGTSTSSTDSLFRLTDADGDGTLEKTTFATGLASFTTIHAD